MVSSSSAPDVHFADRRSLRRWLESHSETSTGIWLVYDKGPQRVLTYDDIVEEAICFGWIDSRPRTLSDMQAKLYLAPRKRGSKWSAKNKQRVGALDARGLLTDAGRSVITRAKADGTWSALDEVERLVEPADLHRALDDLPAARAQWDAFPRSAKRAILEWIAAAKQQDTRQRRIEHTVSEAAVGRRANQWRQRAKNR